MNTKIDIIAHIHIHNDVTPTIQAQLDKILAALEIEKSVAKQTEELRKSTETLNNAVLRNTP